MEVCVQSSTQGSSERGFFFEEPVYGWRRLVSAVWRQRKIQARKKTRSFLCIMQILRVSRFLLISHPTLLSVTHAHTATEEYNPWCAFNPLSAT